MVAILAKVSKTLKDEVRRNGYKRSPDECLCLLREIIPLCGPGSQTKRMTREIGLWLLRGHTQIIAPVCPDYSHRDGKYNFETLNGGVPLLAEIHTTFLRKITEYIPETFVTLLVADHEADDPLLCNVVKKSRDEFSELVNSSVLELRQRVNIFDWTATTMTDFIPDLIEKEISYGNWIRNCDEFGSRLRAETMQRSEMYMKLKRCMGDEEMIERTIHTAAQYVALGKHAKQSNSLVCNHTTTNLAWYLQTEVALLHNPVSVY